MSDLGSNPEKQLLAAGRACAAIAEDISRSLLAFIPNGLQLIYYFILGTLPWRGLARIVTLCSGVNLAQGIAADIAYFVFRPIGFMVGVLIGTTVRMPPYQDQIGKYLYRLSGQTVAGALSGILTLWGGSVVFPSLFIFSFESAIRAIAIGACGGLIAKVLFLLVAKTMDAANSVTVRRNAQRAKALNMQLKKAARQRAKSRILMQSQDIIQQINGPQSQIVLQDFFKNEYEHIAGSIYHKIDRHFNYLTDRACHGDLKAFKRLQTLAFIPQKATHYRSKSPLEEMLVRIFNPRTLAKMKDEVDTRYDHWCYRFLRTKAPN